VSLPHEARDLSRDAGHRRPRKMIFPARQCIRADFDDDPLSGGFPHDL
jgi:hypothetical protein